MLCIFKGRPKVGGVNLDAGDIQVAVEAQVAGCEHDPTIQERQDGCYDFQARVETKNEMFARLASEQNVGERVARAVFAAEAPSQQVITGEARRSSRIVIVSDALLKDDGNPVTLADFPDGWSFGNGITCNSIVRLRNGTLSNMSWVVFPDATESIVRSRLTNLRQLMEG